MPYITVKQEPAYYQMSLDDVMAGITDLSKYVRANTAGTRTFWVERINDKLQENTDVPRMIEVLSAFNKSKEYLIAQNRASLYYSFDIAKSGGGLRRIDAPLPDLMTALRELKFIFESQMHVLYHTSAYAYITGRSTIDAIKRHQSFESKWFLKLDFSNFFGSTTPGFVMDMFSQLYPFSELVKYPAGREELQKALSLCFLNNGLPQGTPISPLITNVMMIAIDHKISNTLRKFNNERFVYTRYADDLLVSCRVDFDKNAVQKCIVDILAEFNAPFSIKPEKTRYGSSSGSNWNLGLMLNKDNEITIGHKNKKQFKAMLHNYMSHRNTASRWELDDLQKLRGKISYYKMIEEEYINHVISQCSQKHRADVLKCLKQDIAGSSESPSEYSAA